MFDVGGFPLRVCGFDVVEFVLEVFLLRFGNVFFLILNACRRGGRCDGFHKNLDVLWLFQGFFFGLFRVV